MSLMFIHIPQSHGGFHWDAPNLKCFGDVVDLLEMPQDFLLFFLNKFKMWTCVLNVNVLLDLFWAQAFKGVDLICKFVMGGQQYLLRPSITQKQEKE